MDTGAQHNIYMKRCLELAEHGLGQVAPNPMVGCVIVHNNRIIGEGFHRQFGAAHAEVNAIEAVQNKDLLRDSTLYVNLEPCSHHGKTPPCANRIVESGIPRVVIANSDPNPAVAGSGIKLLRDAGIEVETGVLEAEAYELNRRFFCWHNKHRPYFMLKWAQTANGYLDRYRESSATPALRITQGAANRIVHLWRSQEPGIMVGTNTALLDNPRLNVRHVDGPQPTRIVPDRNQRLPRSLHLFDETQPTMLIDDTDTDSLEQTIAAIANAGIQSVLVEGGAELLSAFLDANLWDEARVFTGAVALEDGVLAPMIASEGHHTTQQIGPDRLDIYRNPAADALDRT